MTRVATFLIMFAFWVVMSGMFDGFHLVLGVISSLLVAVFSHNLLFFGDRAWPSRLRDIGGMIVYLLWLFWQIIIASLQVARIVLHPRMHELIDPKLIHFETSLKRPFSRVTFAQSITLTPGTITVGLYDNQFTVYALTRSTAESLPGEMERKVARALEADRDA